MVLGQLSTLSKVAIAPQPPEIFTFGQYHQYNPSRHQVSVQFAMAYAAPQPQPANSQSQQQRKKQTSPASTVAQPAQNMAPSADAPLHKAGSAMANLMRSMQNTPPPPPAPPFPLQAKLTIGQPNDKYEQEADRTAQQVVQQLHAPSHAAQPQIQPKFQIHRNLGAAPQPIQAADATTGGTASAAFEQQLNQARSGGQSLKPQVAQQMGSAMNADFSGIKVHTDSTSDQLNRSIQARAFTTGPDIFFKRGEYSPSTKGGQELLAHELTHSLQQGAAVQCKPDISAKYAGNGQPLQPKRFEAPTVSTQPGQNRAMRLKMATRRPLGRLPAVQLKEALPARYNLIQRDDLPAAPTPTTTAAPQQSFQGGSVPDVAPPGTSAPVEDSEADSAAPKPIATYTVEEHVAVTNLDQKPGLHQRILPDVRERFTYDYASDLVSIDKVVVHLTDDDFEIKFWYKDSADPEVAQAEVIAFGRTAFPNSTMVRWKREGSGWLKTCNAHPGDDHTTIAFILKEISDRDSDTAENQTKIDAVTGTVGLVSGSDAATMGIEAAAGAITGGTVTAATGNTIAGKAILMGQYFQESKAAQAETYQSVDRQITNWSPDTFLGVLGVAAAVAAPIFKAFMAFRRYEQFSLQNRKIQGLESSLEQAQNVPEPDAALTESLDYALSKSTRLWWRYFADFVICCCQAINRILALLCPLIAIGSAIVDVVLSATRFLAAFVDKSKGFVKWWKGTRGQKRWESGKTIYDAALTEDPAALDAIRALTLNDSTFLTKSFMTRVLKGNAVLMDTLDIGRRRRQKRTMDVLVRQAIDANQGLYGDSSDLFKSRMEVGMMEWANGTPPASNDVLVAILKVFHNNKIWRQRCSEYLAEEIKSSM